MGADQGAEGVRRTQEQSLEVEEVVELLASDPEVLWQSAWSRDYHIPAGL